MKCLLNKMKKECIGFCLLACVIVLWVGSSIAIQDLFLIIGYYKPYLLTYFNTALFSLYNFALIWKRHDLEKIKEETGED